MTKDEKRLGLSPVAVERQLDPPERKLPSGKRQPHGLYVVDEWRGFDGLWPRSEFWTVVSVAVMEREQRNPGEGGWPVKVTHHIYHGLPGLPWEDAQKLKRKLKEKENTGGSGNESCLCTKR